MFYLFLIVSLSELKKILPSPVRIWICVLLFLLRCFPTTKGMGSSSLLSRWAILPVNQCRGLMELRTCPTTEEVRKFREKVCLGITINEESHELYHCQYDTVYNRTYEFLMEAFVCPKGYYGKVQYKSQLRCNQQHCVRIVCTPCPDDRYQPDDTFSPESLKGCNFARKVVRPEDHLILFQKGNTSSPDIYYCDFFNGFYNEYRQIFCDGHHPCRCVSRYERPVCVPSFDTLPDGSCRSKCLYPRLPKNKFECVSNEYSSKHVQLYNYTTTAVTLSGIIADSGFHWETVIVCVVSVVAMVLVGLLSVIIYRCAVPKATQRRINAIFMHVIARDIFHLRGRENNVYNYHEED